MPSVDHPANEVAAEERSAPAARRRGPPPPTPTTEQERGDEELAAARRPSRPAASVGPIARSSRKDHEHQRHGDQAQEERQQPVVDERRQPQADEEPQHDRGNGGHHLDRRLDPGPDLRRGEMAHVGRARPRPAARPGAWRRKFPSSVPKTSGTRLNLGSYLFVALRLPGEFRLVEALVPDAAPEARPTHFGMELGASQAEEAALDPPDLELVAHQARHHVAAGSERDLGNVVEA